MYACFDQPDLKATFSLTVTAPSRLGSHLQWPRDCSLRGARGSASGALQPPLRHFAPMSRLWCAGRTREHADRHDGIELGLYAVARWPSTCDADADRGNHRSGLRLVPQAFGYPYPFDKFDQFFVPEFNAGAMENAGCVTIMEDYVFRSKVTQATSRTVARKRCCTSSRTCGSATW